jgi:hypothetical protein
MTNIRVLAEYRAMKDRFVIVSTWYGRQRADAKLHYFIGGDALWTDDRAKGVAAAYFSREEAEIICDDLKQTSALGACLEVMQLGARFEDA